MRRPEGLEGTTVNDPKPNPPVVDYAAADTTRQRASTYSIAAVIVSSASVIWFFCPPIFTPAKQDRVGMLSGLLGTILAIVGWR
jgi:hypothetical protein